MTNTYNTLNPLGSTSPKDLFDNASNMDDAMNSLSPSFQDRFDRRRETWAGMETAFQAMLDSFGFVYVADYVDGVPGIVLTSRNQYIVRAGLQYHLTPEAPLPFTTTGNWAADQTSFLAFTDDDTLRVDLADAADPLKGAALVGYQGGTVSSALATLTAAISGANSFRTVATVADLVAGAASGIQYQLTSGYYTAGDTGGGSLYRRVASDTTSASNGGTILVDANNVRWYLCHDGSVNVEQFGAKPDATTNSVPAINTMLAIPAIREVTFGQGPYLWTGAINMVSGKSLRGLSNASTSVLLSGGVTVILRNSTSVSGFLFDCTAQTVSSYLFLINTSFGSMEYITLEDMVLYHCKGFATDDNHATNVATNVRIRNISSRLTKGPGILFRDVWAFLECRDIAMDYVGNVAAQNYTGFSIINNQGCLFDNCEVTGTTGLVAGTNGAQIGFSFNSCLAVYLRRCFADTCGGRGFTFQTCSYARLVMCTTGLCDDTATYFASCTEVQIDNHYAAGRRGLAGATAGIPAMYLGGCTGVTINGGQMLNATGDGVLTALNTTQLVLSGSRMYNNLGRGLTTGAGSVSITSGCVFSANATANYSLATGFDHLSGCQASSGALLNVTGPGAA